MNPLNWKFDLDEARAQIQLFGKEDTDPILIQENLMEILDRLDNSFRAIEKDHDTRRSQAFQLEQALCYTGDAISITTKNGETRLINPAFEEMTKYPGREFIGEKHDIIWDLPEEQSQLNKLKEQLSGGADWNGILKIKNSKGSKLICDVSVSPIIQAETGQITHHVYTIRDITQRVKSEKRLKEQQVFLSQVLKISPNAVAVLSYEGKWLLSNQNLDKLLKMLMIQEQTLLVKQLLSGMREDPFMAIKYTINTKKGKLKHYWIQGRSIKTCYFDPDSNSREYYLFNITDISEMERKNNAILVQQKFSLSRKIEKEMIQRELTNGLVFTLQQPLNVSKAICAHMRTILKPDRDSRTYESLSHLETQLSTFQSGLDRFKQLAEVELPTGDNVDSKELKLAFSIGYQERLKKLGIETKLQELKESILFPLSFEIILLLVICLIENAIECFHEEKEKKIHLCFDQDSHESIIRVEDSGSGIKEENQLKIFEPFYSTKSNHRGLSLCFLYHTMNRIGGRVQLKRSSIGGASFTLYFPSSEVP